MAFQVTAASLTPSRPAPQAPQRRGNDASYSASDLQSVGYNNAFSFTSSPSASSYASSYSGIGASPNRPHSDAMYNSQIVRSGMLSVKEDGFASFFRTKWLVLKEQTLSIHKNEVRNFYSVLRWVSIPCSVSVFTMTGISIADPPCQTSVASTLIYLRDIANVERTDLKPYCLLLETKEKRYYLALKSDEELYGWQDDVYSRSPLMGVSNPTNFVHKVHVGFDPVSGAFTVCVVILMCD
jgi:hypothetical protein